MCIIFPSEISPLSTVLIDCKKTTNTRSLIYKNNMKKNNSETLMGFFINGDIIDIKTSYKAIYEHYIDLIDKEFFDIGVRRIQTDGINNFNTFENNDFIVKSVNIENALESLFVMIKEFNLTDYLMENFIETFLPVIQNYKKTFYNQKTFSELKLILVKFKKFDIELKNTIEIIYEIAKDKNIIIPTAHEISNMYYYSVYGYADNIKNINMEQFKKFCNDNKYFQIQVEKYFDQDKEYFIFGNEIINDFFRNDNHNKKYDLPLNLMYSSIYGFYKNKDKFYMVLKNYETLKNFNFYLEVL